MEQSTEMNSEILLPDETEELKLNSETNPVSTANEAEILEEEAIKTEEERIEMETELVIENLSVNDERAVGGSHRAKAFILNNETNDWDEMATGVCSPEPSEDGEIFAIRLRTEEDTSLVLFTAYFHKGQEIGVQNDTVLTWTTFDGDEAALSFESPVGCEEFWKLICRFHGRSFEEWKSKSNGKEEDSQDQEEEEEGDENEDSGSGRRFYYEDENMTKDDGFYDYSEESLGPKIEIAFPEKPEVSALTEIEDGLYQAFMVPSLRRQISEILIQYRYIPALLEIFEHCEEFGMLEELGKLFRIFKFFFLLNGQEILKELMAPDHFLLVAGVMEYDPLYGPEHAKQQVFRKYLSDSEKFKQIIPIKNEEILQLIHQTFRLQYFKDVILARVLDEESSASFILFIRLNHMAIINAIDNDTEVTEVIRNLLQSPDMELKDQIDLLKFFKEFLTIAKTVTLRKSLQIHQASIVADFMRFITRVLNNREVGDEKESKVLAIGLFTNFIQHDPSQIRTYLIQNDLRSSSSSDPSSSSKNLLNTVIDLFTDPSTCSSIRWQLVTALKILLDTFNPLALAAMAPNGQGHQLNPQMLNHAINQKSGEDFLNYFYPEYACRLLRPLIDFDKTACSLIDPSGSEYFFTKNLPEATAEILFHLCELLCSFTGQHKYRIKYLVLRNLILQNCLLLFKCREKHLQLSGLRVFRATLGVEDEFYFRFFIQHRSFGALFQLYKESGGALRDNLVTSAVLDIFEFLRVPRDSLKTLVRHLSTVYRLELESFGPASVFKGILETEDRIDREGSVVSFASSQTSLTTDTEDEAQQGQLAPLQTKQSYRMEGEDDYFNSIDEVFESPDNSSIEQDVQKPEESEQPEQEEYFPSKLKESIEDEDEDHFELLMKKSSSTNDPGSPTKKMKL